ncbi:MAG: DEAD/DEAH box helicase [Hyphomicrobiales bacterium]|nr:MAG: DEAD/DEAH box helicase [Hyphomicrobiales bacterium]
MTQFQDLGLSPTVLKAATSAGYESPTPIQQKAIPIVLEGRDIMGLAQTGSGKTAAFGLPIIDKLLNVDGRPRSKEIRALILAPTRELVAQIADNLRSYVRHTHLRIGMVVGGTSINVQQKNLGRGTDILVATPGRLLDLVERRAVHLNSAKFLVLDEADQMLDLGFIHDLRKISKLVGTPRQTLLFSATMPKLIEELSRSYLNDPVRVETSPPGRAVDKVTQSVHFVHQTAKTEKLKECLAEREDDLSLVFSRTKHGAERLMKHLVQCGHKATSIHGNKSQGQRTRAINEFRSGQVRILVATDVAARGIDIPGVTHVYNFDLPDVAEAYVHRIGRTARAGAKGEAVAFCAPEEVHLLGEVERLMGMSIPTASGGFTDQEIANAPKKGKGRAGRSGNRSNNRSRPGAKSSKRGSAHGRGGAQSAGEAGKPNTSHGKPRRSNRKRQGASAVAR